MCFWQVFAWIAVGWALIVRRGKGILIRKAPSGSEPFEPKATSGPGWKLVSTKVYPGRPSPEAESATEADPESDPEIDAETDPETDPETNEAEPETATEPRTDPKP